MPLKVHSIAPNLRFGRLMTIRRVLSPSGMWRWECLCDCGKVCLVAGTNLGNGRTRSCGCLRRPPSQKTHGLSGSVEYETWRSMKDRCYNPRAPQYVNYGGRGIEVCSRWLNSFEHFLSDMGRRPSSRHSLDRIDNHGHYEPENCRWATADVQQNNRRSNHYVEYMGERMTVTQAAKKAGANIVLVRSRVKRGWPIDRALS